jgi:hypothetical protein
MTKEEFVEMLTIMSRRSSTGDVMAARIQGDVGVNEPDAWGSMVYLLGGKLYVDDSDEDSTRDNGWSDSCTSTRLYGLHQMDNWPDGLFEKLVSYTWWIDPEDEINLLDVIAQTL